MQRILFLTFLIFFPLMTSAEVVFQGQVGAGEAYNSQNVRDNVKKAEDGCVQAQYLVGMAYLYGYEKQDIPQDTEKGFYWLNKAADQDAAEAYYEIGVAYRYGIGVDRDGQKWEEYNTKAADQGLIYAYDSFMDVYRGGDRQLGVKKDDDKYLHWLRISAEDGRNTLSLMNMANRYRYGNGVEKDINKSFEWLMKAVEQDDMSAQRTVGEYFENGLGTEKDLVKAYMMYDLGGTAGNEAKQAVAKKMTEEQIQEAISLSRKWQEEHNSVRPSYYGLQYQKDGSYR